MSKLLVFYIALFSCGISWSQQVPLNNHALQNPFVYNPAFTGFSQDVELFLMRNQRFGSFSGPSVNNYLTVDGAIMNNKAGIGFQIAHQTQGLQQQISSSLSYAYGIQFKRSQTLRFGVSAGILDNRVDKDAINVLQYDDPYIMTMRQNVSTFDMSAGLLYQFKDLKVGLAVPQLLGNKVTFDKENSRGYYRLARHFMLSSEYTFHLKDKFNLTPNLMARFVPGAPLQYDATLLADYKKMIWASATYKSQYALQFNAGVNLAKRFKLGYSYEYIIGDIKKYSSGIHHEIMLGFSFPTGKEKIIHETTVTERNNPVDTNITIINNITNNTIDSNLLKKLDDIEGLLKNALVRIDSLENQLLALQKENDRLIAENNQLKNASKDAELYAKIDDLEQKLKDAQAKIDHMEREKLLALNAKKDIEQPKESNDQTKTIDSLNVELSMAKKRIAELEAENDRLSKLKNPKDVTLAKKADDLTEKLKDSEGKNKELTKENKKLAKENERLEKAKEKLELAQKEKGKTDPVINTQPLVEPLPYTTGSHFIELDSTDSPNGYYVVSGVYKNRKNAFSALTTISVDHPGVYVVINQLNTFHYVVIKYTTDYERARATLEQFKQTSERDVWILNYQKPK